MNRGLHMAMALAVTSLCASSKTGQATENGFINYPIGVNTIMAGAMPAPEETWYQNYAVYYNSSTFTGGSGQSAVPGFGAHVFANAIRILHGWDANIGPFRLGSGIVVPIVNADVGSAFGSESATGIGDITIQPLYFAWSTADRTFFGYAGIDIFVPSGVNTISSNSVSLNPAIFSTWMPIPQIEISTAIGIEFHDIDGETNYRSGNVFYTDYGVNARPFEALPALSIGVGGYVITQLSDDKLDGVVFRDGFRQEGWAIGPQISYGTPAGAIALKWQHEVSTQNRPEGDRYWLQFQLPLGFNKKIGL